MHARDPTACFLSDRDDNRSSFYLEDAATEFQYDHPCDLGIPTLE